MMRFMTKLQVNTILGLAALLALGCLAVYMFTFYIQSGGGCADGSLIALVTSIAANIALVVLALAGRGNGD